MRQVGDTTHTVCRAFISCTFAFPVPTRPYVSAAEKMASDAILDCCEKSGLRKNEVKVNVSGIEPMSMGTTLFHGIVNYVGASTNPPDLHVRCIKTIQEIFEAVFQCDIPAFEATRELEYAS